MPSARGVALELIGRIRRERSYANLVLAHSAELAALDGRDRALATRIIYGTLQMEGSLDAALEHVAARGRLQVPPQVRDLLRMGAYQLLWMDVPPHAAVGETVALLSGPDRHRWRGLANALLRELSAERAGFPWMERSADEGGWLSLTYGHARWLVERLLEAYGPAESETFLAADNEPAPTHLRVNTLRTTVGALAAELAARGYQVSPAGDGFPDGLIVEGPPGVWSEPEDGRSFVVQDLGSQMAPRLLAPRPGERVLDMACGRGGKTTHLVALMQDEGEIVALDASEAKVRQCAELAATMGATIVRPQVGDARAWAVEADEPFDAVLLDAPCSGTGTLRRRAELRWRLTPERVEELLTLQRELLVAAAALVRPGGRLVYATCSVLPEENLRQVERLAADERGRPLTVTEHRQLLPHRDGTDGHFAALLAREA